MTILSSSQNWLLYHLCICNSFTPIDNTVTIKLYIPTAQIPETVWSAAVFHGHVISVWLRKYFSVFTSEIYTIFLTFKTSSTSPKKKWIIYIFSKNSLETLSLFQERVIPWCSGKRTCTSTYFTRILTFFFLNPCTDWNTKQQKSG